MLRILLTSALIFAAASACARAEPWSKNGSYPPRPGNDVRILIDGQSAYAEIATAMKKARTFIDATISYGEVNFRPVPRGETLFDLLRTQSRRRTDVKLVLWEPACKTEETIPDPTPNTIDGVNTGPGTISARWDRGGTYRGWGFLDGLNHQKTYVMDNGRGGLVAFVGGINPAKSYWDTIDHNPRDPRRDSGKNPPLHDVFYRIEGPAAADVLANFVERYNGASAAHREATQDAAAPTQADRLTPIKGGVEAQILRTIAPKKYRTTWKGDRGIEEAHLNALDGAGKGSVVYLENQYFFDPVIVSAIRKAAGRGAKVILVLTSKPNEGTWLGLLFLCLDWVAKEAVVGKNVLVLTLGASVPDPQNLSKTLASEIYVHSKNLFVLSPNRAAMVGGSANIDRSSMLFHAEMDVAVADRACVKRWLTQLWAEHLQIPLDEVLRLAENPDTAFEFFQRRADEDARLLSRGRPAPGRVFPFGIRFPPHGA